MLNKDYWEATEIIRNEFGYDWDRQEYITIHEAEMEKAFNAIKAFVAAHARGERRKRIMQAGYSNVNDWGILRRLWYYPETGKVFYCCGQDYQREMSILRDAFDWKKGR